MAADPAVKVHLYGKPVRPGRKVGHVTALGSDQAAVRDRARRAASYLAPEARNHDDRSEVAGPDPGSEWSTGLTERRG